jgi:hypothetical protein
VPGFLYFIPGLDTRFHPDRCREALRNERLHSIFRDAQITQLGPPAQGPDGIRGCFIAATSAEFDAVHVQYAPKEQTWKKCGETHWLGTWNERPPSSKTLARPNQIRGTEVEIDGQKWLIPITGPGGVALPTTWDVSDDLMEWNPEVEDKYKDLMKSSEEVMSLLGDPKADIVHQSKMNLQFCADLLHVNYRVYNREIGRMKLLRTATTVRTILEAGLGVEIVEREKIEAATVQNGSSADSGGAVS